MRLLSFCFLPGPHAKALLPMLALMQAHLQRVMWDVFPLRSTFFTARSEAGEKHI